MRTGLFRIDLNGTGLKIIGDSIDDAGVRVAEDSCVYCHDAGTVSIFIGTIPARKHTNGSLPQTPMYGSGSRMGRPFSV